MRRYMTCCKNKRDALVSRGSGVVGGCNNKNGRAGCSAKKSVVFSEQVFIAALVKAGVERVEILGVEVILSDAEGIGETIKGEWILRYPLFLNFPFDI